ncbi:hypothetical protein DTO212C5_1889 [Paecilomyces variotii]|nr:hypothetical protein DTO212C5_1889 [Paecilomyces variotii]
MSLNSVRRLSATAKRNILNLIGKTTLEEVQAANGSNGDRWVSSVENARDNVGTQYEDVTDYMIQGANAHQSSKDPSDTQKVITLAFFNKSGTRMLSGHVHEDGTFKLAESRAGKGKAKTK